MKKVISVRKKARLALLLAGALWLCCSCSAVSPDREAASSDPPLSVPTAVEGADPALVALYADNAVIVDGYRYRIANIVDAFEPQLVWLSGQAELCDFLLGRPAEGRNEALAERYRTCEGIQNAILFEYDAVKTRLEPVLHYAAFCEQAAAQHTDVIEQCLRALYAENSYVQQGLADGSYSQEAFEADLTALAEKERQRSCLAILYVYQAELFPQQTVNTPAFEALLSARFDDPMYAYELLVHYDSAITLPEPAAFLAADR